jgi:hypothetical protein
MKHLILFLLLSCSALSQTWPENNVPGTPMRSKTLLISSIPAGGSLECFSLRAGTAIERIYVVVDTLISNVDALSVWANETLLFNMSPVPTGFAGTDPIEYEAQLQGGKMYYGDADYSVYMSYTTSGGVVKGKIKIYLQIRELFK